MAGIEELDSGSRQVFSKRLGSRGNEKRIVLAPDRQQWRLRLTEIFLEFRVKLYVGRVVQIQIQLDVFVPRPFEQSGIQCVRLRRNTLRICYTVRVLPARSTGSQNALTKY